MRMISLAAIAGVFVATAACSGEAVAGGPVNGSYECWGNGSPRMLMNFTVTAPGHYRASDDSTGTFTFDAASKKVVFTGYMKEVMPDGFVAIYHTPQGKPTVSFRGPSGAEAEYCEKV